MKDEFSFQTGAGLPVVDVGALKSRTEKIMGTLEKLSVGDRVVAEIIGRDGEIMELIYNVPLEG